MLSEASIKSNFDNCEYCECLRMIATIKQIRSKKEPKDSRFKTVVSSIV